MLIDIIKSKQEKEPGWPNLNSFDSVAADQALLPKHQRLWLKSKEIVASHTHRDSSFNP